MAATKVTRAKIANGIPNANSPPLIMKYETPSAIKLASTAGDLPKDFSFTYALDAKYKPTEPRTAKNISAINADQTVTVEVRAPKVKYRNSRAKTIDSKRNSQITDLRA